MNFPNNVKYTEEHEWIRVEGDIAYVGISDYAQEQLGDIVFVDITFYAYPFVFLGILYIVWEIHNAFNL